MTNEKSSRFADWLVDGLIVLLIIVVVVVTALVAAFAGSAFADVDTSGTTLANFPATSPATTPPSTDDVKGGGTPLPIVTKGPGAPLFRCLAFIARYATPAYTTRKDTP